LFRIASSISSLLHDTYSFDKYDRIIALITQLKDYTVYHFKTEEEYMLQIKYKKYFSQKVEHDDFIKAINNVNFDKVDENQDEYIEKMLGFVSNWIINHILERDKAIKAD
jgi:hemerythrin